MDFEYRTFFMDLHVKELNSVVEKLKEYNIEKYLVAHEQYNRKGEEKPHIHVLCYTTKQTLTNIVKYFVETYKLRNTSGKNGGRRKYGTHANGKPIHDMEKFATYLCKDGNVISSFEPDQVKQWMNNAYQKEQSSTHMEKALEILLKENYSFKPDALESYNKYNNKEDFDVDWNEYCKIRMNKIRSKAIDIILSEDLPIALNKNNINKLLKDYIKCSDLPIQTKTTLYYKILFLNYFN